MSAIVSTRFIRPAAVIVMGGTLFLLAAATASAETKPAAKAVKAQAPTNAAPEVIEIPKSEFAIPTSVTQGRDPFFPNSTRISTARVKPDAGPKAQPAPVVTLTLQGISGTDAKRFALISGRTFEAGEEGDVTVGKSKVRVRCLTIKEDSVLVEADGKPQELRLRPGI